MLHTALFYRNVVILGTALVFFGAFVALGSSIWDTAQAMEASRVKASGLRSDAVSVVGGSVQSVVEYEVAIHERTSS